MIRFSGIFIALSAALFLGSLRAITPQSFLPPSAAPQNVTIVVKNCPLVKFHKNVISVMDVKKRMDLLLLEKDPASYDNPLTRYRFYQESWKRVLNDIIHEKMMLLESEELKVEVTDLTIKEELNKRFGPNVIPTITKLGLSSKEAYELVKTDQIVKVMSWYQVWSKAILRVTPSAVKKNYEEYLAKNPPEEKWTYKFLTLKGHDAGEIEAKAKTISATIEKTHPRSLEELKQQLQESPEKITTTISSEITLNQKEIAPNIRMLLNSLGIQMISEPKVVMSKTQDETICRVYQLIDYSKEQAKNLDALKETLENELLNAYGNKLMQEYIQKLKKHFCYQELAIEKISSSDFCPFELVQM